MKRIILTTLVVAALALAPAAYATTYVNHAQSIDWSRQAGVTCTASHTGWGSAQSLVDPVNYGSWGVDTWDDGWVMVDLGQTRSIGGVSNATYDVWGRGPTSFKVQVGSATADPTSDSDWQTVVDVPSWNRFTNQWAYSFDPVVGQRVRYLYNHYPSDHYMMMDTFSVTSGAAITQWSLAGNDNSFIGDPYGYNMPEAWFGIDGDELTFTSTYLHAAYPEVWFMLDIGPNKKVDQVVLNAPHCGWDPTWANIADLQIQYSTLANPNPGNSGDWVTAYTYDGGGTDDLSLIVDFASSVEASKWRLYSDSGARFAFTEIQFNEAVVPEPASIITLALGALGVAGSVLRKRGA